MTSLSRSCHAVAAGGIPAFFSHVPQKQSSTTLHTVCVYKAKLAGYKAIIGQNVVRAYLAKCFSLLTCHRLLALYELQSTHYHDTQFWCPLDYSLTGQVCAGV